MLAAHGSTDARVVNHRFGPCFAYSRSQRPHRSAHGRSHEPIEGTPMQIGKYRHKVPAVRWILLAALLSFTVATAAATQAPTNTSTKSAGDDSQPFAAAYYDTLVGATRSAREQLPAMAKAADAVAERLLAGGDLYIAADREDFVSEGMVRSGGLM